MLTLKQLKTCLLMLTIISQRVGEDYSLYTLQNLKIKADAALALEATGQVGIKSAAEIFDPASCKSRSRSAATSPS